jgi:hypothetical protein
MSFTDFIAYSSMALIAVGVYLEVEGEAPYKKRIGHALTGVSIAGLVYCGLVYSGWLSATSHVQVTAAARRPNYLGIFAATCLLVALAIQLVMIERVFKFKGRLIRFFSPAYVVKSTDTTSGLVVTQISPDAIRAEVKSRPPFERTIAAKKYEGIAVEWSGKFYDLFMVREERARLHIVIRSTIETWDAMIVVEVSLSEYPAVKILTPGTRIRMQGRIKTVTVGMPEYIELEDAKLFIG